MNLLPKILCFLLLFSASISSQVDDVSNDKFEMSIENNILKIPYYGNQDIYTGDPNVDKAVIVVHGANRDAYNYFDNMVAAANKRPTLTENTIIIAPQFLIEDDIDVWSLDNEHLYWTSGGWRSGSNSRDQSSNPRPARIPSYAVLDSLIIHLANTFPNLQEIIFTGHSAGGQLTHRIAATSPISDIICSDYGLQIKFVVANPSSYVYMDGQRRVSGTVDQFQVPSTSCNGYNEWRFGLEDLFTYPNRVGVDSIRNMMKRRIVTYLLGLQDNDPDDPTIDNSCEAKLQGSHRYERGLIQFNYMNHYYGTEISENQTLVTVPDVGHNNFEMYTSSEGLFALFEKPFTSCDQSVTTKDISRNISFDIYPNPANDYISIQTSQPGTSQIMEISLYDLKGEMVGFETKQMMDKCDISHLMPGIYILLVRLEDGSFIHNRIVIER